MYPEIDYHETESSMGIKPECHDHSFSPFRNKNSRKPDEPDFASKVNQYAWTVIDDNNNSLYAFSGI
jgi:hypothetical protein